MRTARIYGSKLLVMAALAMTGCWQEDFSDCPGGKLVLETTWDETGEEVDIPESYRAVIGSWSEVLSGNYNEIGHTFDPGDYRVYVYNTPDKITVNGTTATVTASGSGIDNMPGWLFTYNGDIQGLTENEYRTVQAHMAQQVGRITYEITAEGENIKEIGSIVTEVVSTRLDGIASSMNIGTGALSGSSSVSPAFAMEGRDRYTAESRIIGTAGAMQTLTLVLKTPSGATQTLSGEAAPVLAGFNTFKRGYYHIIIRITAVNYNDGSITEWTLNGEPGMIL